MGFLSFLTSVLLLFGPSGGDLPSDARPPEPVRLGAPVTLPDDASGQFDFWLGEWDVANKHLVDSGDWIDSGHAVARIQPVAAGRAVLEQWTGSLKGDPLFGFSLRAYDPTRGKWVIFLNWHGSKPAPFFQMYGDRRGERMEQFPPNDDKHLRYSFSEAREDSCQWEAARSEDGATWLTNWIMQFTRRQPPLKVDATNAPIVRPTGSDGSDAMRGLDFLIGAWEGTARTRDADGAWQEESVRVRVTSMIDGFGLLQFVDTAGISSLTAMAYTGPGGWQAVLADGGRPGLTHMQAGDRVSEDAVTFTSLESGVRESWSCGEDGGCRWTREVSAGDDEWNIAVEATLRRSISDSAWIDIRNARAPFPDVLTGGQVTREDLVRAARNGYRTVINTRSEGEEGALEGEADLVRELGMDYRVIPVAGADDVNGENAKRLAEALQVDGALPAIVHCGSGNRVGALFALKAYELDGASAESALEVGLRAGLTRLEPLVREKLGLPVEK